MPRVYFNRRNTAYYEYEVDSFAADGMNEYAKFGPLVQLLARTQHPTGKQVRDICYSERRKHESMDDVFNTPGPSGWPPLVLAAHRGHSEAVTALLDLGANIECQDPTSGWTALMYAVSLGHQATIKALLDHEADVNKFVAPHDWNALCVAIHAGRPDIMGLLLQSGANMKLIKRRHPGLAETYTNEFENHQASGNCINCDKIDGQLQSQWVQDYFMHP